MKQCFKCKKEKPLEDFYEHKKMKDGRLGKCKECTKKDNSANREKNIEHYLEYDKQRANLPHRVKAREEYQKNNPDKFRAYKEKYINNNLQKRKAVNTTNNKKRDGGIEQKPCLMCGDINVQAHHEDYNKPLEIIWLCPKHHAELHKNKRKNKKK